MHLGDFYNSPNYVLVEFLQMFMFGLMHVGRTLQILFFKEASQPNIAVPTSTELSSLLLFIFHNNLCILDSALCL